MLRQFLHSNPVAASYLFGCDGKAAGVVVDPVGDIVPYIETANTLGVRIFYVIHTHLHADHVPAGPALAVASGAQYVLFAGAAADFPFKGVQQLGDLTARVLHTPGHTPQHICMVVTERSRAAEPWFVLSGHTLMVGDLGRTELASSAEEDGRALFRPVQVLKILPEYLEVLPAAYSGAVCGRKFSGKPTSTIGFEARHRTAFHITNKAEFVANMTADIPPPPPAAAQNRAINSGQAVPA